MFTVEKKSLVEAHRVISKVVKDLSSIYLLSSIKDKALWLIANEPTHYVKILVPDTKIEKKALVGLKADIFASTLSMRGSVYKASYDEGNARLDIACGSKNSVYVLDVTKDSIARDKEGSNFISISAKKVGIMREMFKAFTFSTPDANFTGSALFKNTSEGMSVLYASVNTCAFYDTSEPIAKREFEVTVPMGMVMDVLSVVTTEARVSILDNAFIIESDTIEAVVPTMEDETKGYTEFYQTLRGNKEFMKGKIELKPKKILPELSSVRVTSSGADLVKVSFSDTKGKLLLESKNGVCSDNFKVESNTLGKISLEIPEAYLHATLATASASSEVVSLFVGVNENLYKLTAKNKDYAFMAVGPIST